MFARYLLLWLLSFPRGESAWSSTPITFKYKKSRISSHSPFILKGATEPSSTVSTNSTINDKNLDAATNNNGVNGNSVLDQPEARLLRFSGVGRVYAQQRSTKKNNKKNHPVVSAIDVVDRLSKSVVAVIGLGGVGSWSAEALCRSGVGHLILIDLDDICISNTNRQLHALASTVGQMKIDAMKKRMVDINPECNVTLIHEFVSLQNAKKLIQSLQPLTAVLDAIDGSQEKAALLAACTEQKIPVVTVGGAAGCIDPTQIVCRDLTEAFGDKLLGSCRTNMRKYHGFAPGLAFSEMQKTKKTVKKWNIESVYTMEQPPKPSKNNNDDDSTSSFRMCDGALGTACFVTGTVGFLEASRIVERIAMDDFKLPGKG